MTIARVVQPSRSTGSSGDEVLDIEASGEENLARELFEITHGSTTYRITTNTRDVFYDGNVYTAEPSSRSELSIFSVQSGEEEMELSLRPDHPFVKRYTRMLTPPRNISIVVRRLYSELLVETIWTGVITSMAINDTLTDPVARFRCPSFLSEQMSRPLPARTVGRRCPFTVYDDRCQVDRDSVLFHVDASILYVSGREVRVDIGNPSADGWSTLGEMLVTSGEAIDERVTVTKQTYVSLPSSVVTLELHEQVPGLKVGDTVTVFAGCDLSIEMCHNRFDNKQRFGGQPQLPTTNFFLPAGFGPPED